MTDTTLGEIGERKIVSDILSRRYRDGNVTFGDDVADFGMQGGTLIATTDPAPEPVAWEVLPRDFYDWGWLLAALNLSDIAASGGQPLGLLTSYTLPNSTLLSDFLRLLDGVDDACKASGTLVRGGNLKEGLHGVVEATALGIIDGRPMSRLGAEPGDRLYAFGEVGAFWGALLQSWNLPKGDALDRSFSDVLTRPRALVSVGRDLRVSGLAKSCMDASDGIYAAFVALTVDQGLGFVFEPDMMSLSPRVVEWSRVLSVQPARLALGFGNLELVCAADPRHEPKLRQIAKRNRVRFTSLGSVIGSSELLIETDGHSGGLNNFDNERFTAESQFTGGLHHYRERLLHAALSV